MRCSVFFGKANGYLLAGVFFFCTMIVLPLNTFANPHFPDTGQSLCYDDSKEIHCPAVGQPFHGQDAQYRPRLPRSYTKLGEAGAVLPDNARHADEGGAWVMTRDNVTGLIWELKTSSGLQNKASTYSWYDPNHDTNGGNAGSQNRGSCDVGDCDTYDYIQRLNTQNFGGFSDWRLPEIKELLSLVNYGVTSPMIDTRWFPDTDDSSSSRYWTATTAFNNNNNAWLVNYYRDGPSDLSKTNAWFVRAVRGPKTGALDPFIDNGDGTVTDVETGLMWMRCSEGHRWNGTTCAETAGTYTWQQALARAENLEYAGYSDWRMPNINELQSLIDYKKRGIAIDEYYFPETSVQTYWSSTTNTASHHNIRSVWSVRFGYGSTTNDNTGKTGRNHLRAVRGGNYFLPDATAACIFNGLEDLFPEYIAPASAPTDRYEYITFRYYTQTLSALGISTSLFGPYINSIIYYNPSISTEILNLGSIDAFKDMLECQ